MGDNSSELGIAHWWGLAVHGDLANVSVHANNSTMLLSCWDYRTIRRQIGFHATRAPAEKASALHMAGYRPPCHGGCIGPQLDVV